MRLVPPMSVAVAVPLLLPALGADKGLTFDQRIEIVRGLTAEYATARVALPRSKKPLKVDAKCAFDKSIWDAAGREYGPAARVGDLVQITKVEIEDDRLTLQVNGGFKGGRRWYEGVQVGVGTRTTPVSSGAYSLAPGGTTLQIVFPGRLPPLQALEIKKTLLPVLDFNVRSATEQYVEKLPPEVQKAVREKRAIEGMDRDQVLLALGRPRTKVREVKDGIEYEDWIYGDPPGRITFVTFNGDKVVRVKDTYAGLGGEVAPPLPTPR